MRPVNMEKSFDPKIILNGFNVRWFEVNAVRKSFQGSARALETIVTLAQEKASAIDQNQSINETGFQKSRGRRGASFNQKMANAVFLIHGLKQIFKRGSAIEDGDVLVAICFDTVELGLRLLSFAQHKNFECALGSTEANIQLRIIMVNRFGTDCDGITL
jgi:hypothetical protein